MNLQCNIEVNNPHASPVIIGCRMANGKNFTITNNTIVSFKLRDKPLWAFQFHPEVDRATVFERLAIYKTKYTSGEEEFNKVLDSLVETPDSHKLMLNFVDNVLLNYS